MPSMSVTGAGEPSEAKPVQAMSDRRLVFVGGLHRSGTTLLARALTAHPKIAGFADTGVVEDEGQYLQSLYPSDAIAGGAGRFGFDSRARLTEASPLATAANADRLRREWAPHWPPGGLWCLEKSPANMIRARFLQALFPDASFIFITRHPVAVALAVRKWSRIGIYALLHHWLHCHRLLHADLPSIRRYCVASYEEFSSLPEETLNALYDFLRLEPHRLAIPIARDVNAGYFRTWRQDYAIQDRDRGTQGFDPRLHPHLTYRERVVSALDRRLCRLVENGPWKGTYTVALANREAQDAVEMFEEEVNELGYSLLDLDRHPGLTVRS
jgi:Sulfotransferase family